MRTIQTRGSVSEDGKLTIQVPSDVAPGEHAVTIVIGDPSDPNMYWCGQPTHETRHRPPTQGDMLKELGVVAVPWHGWPSDATFGRDQVYDDDGW